MVNEELTLALNNAKANANYGELSQEFLVDLVHSTLAFEYPTLKKEEVNKVLNGDVVGVNAEKVQNITNQKNAFSKAQAMAKENVELNENSLKDLHQILAEGMPNVGGLYRNVNISVKGSNHTPCSHEKVYDRMYKYFEFLAEGPKGDILEYISYSLLQLAKVHPFLDCNGRLARLVLNYELMKNGFLPVYISENEREEYVNAVEAFKVEKEITPFVNLLTKLEIKSLNK